ncbi:enoyl-CoA hydratase/isomerase family protein [Niallia sp. Krafla_26]|uniref:enoyl-CoA hydratase/isomerase family protein n=1 Tax=Niallia sp. Krafla_26 TaxID=3064703 RepID=UPI003D172FD3
MENYLYLIKKDEIGTIYINRPEKKNAFNKNMWETLIGLLEIADQDSEIKVLVIRGEDSSAFVSGADMSEFHEFKTGEQRAEINEKYTARALEMLKQFRKPTIAMIQKYCIGAGCAIAVACDFRFSDDQGVFAITPSKIGLVYSFNSTKQLIDLIGSANGKYLLMSGERIDAYQAAEMGLVHQVFSSEELELETYQFARILCSRSQSSLRGMKRIIGLVTEGIIEDNEETKRLVMESYTSDDHKEGVASFLEKRKPKFSYS